MINIGDWISGDWSHLQPHKRAIIAEDRPLTYQEVNLRVNQLCHFLLRLGVQKGDRILSFYIIAIPTSKFSLPSQR